MNAKIEDLYSRQLPIYGKENMEKIYKLKIFIYGLKGIGIEIAKNLLLSGAKYLDIFDNNICEKRDMGNNFYLIEDDLNKRRDEACISKLKLLNCYAEINIYNGNNIIDDVKKYNLIIITEIMNLDVLNKININCRKNKIGFIYTLCLGLASSIFIDFGENHIIKDRDDSPKESKFIKRIIKENEKLIFLIDNSEEEKNYFFKFGVFKKFGIKKIKKKIKKIKKKKKKKIGIDEEIIIDFDIENYKGGGIIEEIEIPEIINYQSLEKKFEEPYNAKNLTRLDRSKKKNEEFLHLSIIALHQYYKDNKSLPKINDMNDAGILISLAEKIFDDLKKKNYFWLKKIDKINRLYTERVSRWSQCQLSPVCSFLGGIVAQEAFKLTGKFIPFNQWFWFDFFEVIEDLPDNIDRNVNNSRYDDQIAIFGNEIHEKLKNLNIFLVGAGALGCEFLKNFSLNGISTSKNNFSKVTVTDNDIIEVSNLNRQFLFHEEDVTKSKSKCACEAVKKFNPDFNCEAFQLLLNENSENFFIEDFWMKQNYVFTAVDNISARNYIDEKCCFFSIPYIDSGTLGTIGSMNVFYPHKTICYRDMYVEKEKEIPFCTLKNFPSKFEHCIEWAKSKFYSIFEDNINKLNLILKKNNKNLLEIDLNEFEIKDEEKKFDEIIIIYNILRIYKERSIKKILEFCIKYYNKFFVENINELLKKYPLDFINEEGILFWSGNKRPPKIVKFNPDDNICLMFLNYTSKLLCKIFNIKYGQNHLEDYLDSFNFEISFINDNTTDIKKKIIEILKNINENNEITPQIFDKDNEEDGHINIIYSISLIRARNYDIEELDIFQTKNIAGKIIPALSTTTSSIVGLACIQLYLLVQKRVNSLKCANINIGVNFYDCSYPEKTRFYKDEENPLPNQLPLKLLSEPFNIWDYIEIKESLTAKELISILEKKYDIYIDFISCNQHRIIQPLLMDKDNPDFSMKIENLYEKYSKIKLNLNRKILELKISASKEDYSILIPPIKYIFK